MGAILSFFFSSKKPVRTLMLGLDAAGKTTILYKLKLGEVVHSIPTIGFNVEEVSYGSLQMNVWDVGGQDRIRKLWRHYYIGTDLLIWIVDSNDDTRLEEAREELSGLLKEEELKNAVLLVYANKSDLPNARSVAEVASRLKLNELRGRKWHVQSSSAVSGDGLFEGLGWAANALKTQKTGMTF